MWPVKKDGWVFYDPMQQVSLCLLKNQKPRIEMPEIVVILNDQDINYELE